jgi:hypothetical protein
VITRSGRAIFYRCKTFAPAPQGSMGPNGSLAREVAHSFSYYREKLGGKGIGSILLRCTSVSSEEISDQLADQCDHIQPLKLSDGIELADGVQFDDDAAQRLAPAIGAAIARTG